MSKTLACPHTSHDDWVVVDESPAVTVPSVPETSSSSTLYAETPTLADGNNLHVNPHLNETEELEDDATNEDLHIEHTESVSLSDDRQVQLDDREDGPIPLITISRKNPLFIGCFVSLVV